MQKIKKRLKYENRLLSVSCRKKAVQKQGYSNGYIMKLDTRMKKEVSPQKIIIGCLHFSAPHLHHAEILLLLLCFLHVVCK